MNRKVFFVVAALIIVVYIVVTAVGLGGNDSFEIPMWAQNLGFNYDTETGEADTGGDDSGGGASERVSKSLSVDDLGPTSSFCRSAFSNKQFDFTTSQSKCDFVINSDDSQFSTVRKVSFQLQTGNKIHLELTQPDQLTVKNDFTSDQTDLDVDIFEDGGSMSIECQEPDDNDSCTLIVQ